MKSASAQAGKPRNLTRFSRDRLAAHRKDAVGLKCARDPFIERSLTSTDPDLKDIAECIVLGEAELTVGFSKIERALVALQETSGNADTFENLRAYQERVGNALTMLRQIEQTTEPRVRSHVEKENPKC
ncbi:hypothetical protein [Tropicimonas sp. IMCC34043]|uniref:hypothetical protein n=1 Tax=Tropicimonas sp. IMCC34043 TaxID=2248760 RepID=UPI0013004D09|nr:hypothetical protein [Tropicimonas sp. IMCC34043]